MSQNKDFDLTDKSEYNQALQWIETILFFSPTFMLIRGIANLLNSSVPESRQVDAAIKLIEAGKKNGLKKMKFKVSKDAGIKLKTNSFLDGFGVSAELISNGEMEIEIEYK